MVGDRASSQHAAAAAGSFDVARVLRSAAPAIVSELGPALGALSDTVVRAAVQRALGEAQWPDDGYRVRADRGPGSDGAWRFDLLVERSDSVLAALEVRNGADDLERQVFALSHLSLALARGIAERGFLFAVARRGTAPTGEAPADQMISGASHDRRRSPLLIARLPLAGGSPRELTVLEARRSEAG